jgi:hypothetical protein
MSVRPSVFLPYRITTPRPQQQIRISKARETRRRFAIVTAHSVASCQYAVLLQIRHAMTSSYTLPTSCPLLRSFEIPHINLYEPCVLYIGRAYRCPPDVTFYIFFQQIQVLSILNMLHTLRFSLQNAVYFIMLPFFGSCIIHILHTGCAKI